MAKRAKTADEKKAAQKRMKEVHKSNPHFQKGFEAGHQPVQVASMLANTFWKRRAKHGRDKIFSTPEQLIETFEEYIEYANKAHLNKIELFKGQKIYVEQLPLYTLRGFTLFCGVSSSYFAKFFSEISDDDPRRDDFFTIKGIIEDTIYQRKYEGAQLGHFNANLTGYDLAIRQDVPSQTTNNGLTITTTSDEGKNLLKSVKERLNKADKKKKE